MQDHRATPVMCVWVAILLTFPPMLNADEGGWPHWRGPAANGVAEDSSRPPVKWSREENLAWSCQLPGQGTSTPIVVGHRVFILAAIETVRVSEEPVTQKRTSKTVPPEVYYRFVVLCIDRRTGETIWQKTAIEAVPHEGHHPTHTYAGSSPVTDGKHLFVSFGSRGIYCYSLDGELKWEMNLGNMETRYGWGESVTPVVDGDSLIINWDQEKSSFIICLDTATGLPRWKTQRPNEVTSWNTPLVTEFHGVKIVIANGTHRVRAYDLKTGEEIWSIGGQTVNAIPSPIRYRDNAIVMSGYRGSLAMSVPLNSRGRLSDADPVWKHVGGTPYVPSPLLVDSRIYFTGSNRNVLTVLDANNGERTSEPTRLSALRSIYASPIAAAGHIYILDREGTCVVLSQSENPEIIHVNRIHDTTDASPVAVENQLLLRSWSRLYCFEN